MELFSKQLLNGLQNFEPGYGKAYRVYLRCRMNKKYKLAEAIEKKYNRSFPKYDAVVAYGWNLLAQGPHKTTNP